jgi:hypothetical protein
MLKQGLQRVTLPILIAALGFLAAGEAAAQRSRVIPANTVVRAELDDELSTRTSEEGDRFTATLDDRDYSGFPEGTRFEGRVTEVRHSAKNQPGILDVRFHRAILPDGTAVPITGTLASLGDKDVRRSDDGRLESRHAGGKEKFETKWVGYGAGAGAVLSTIFGGNFLKGALLGAVGGAVYSYLNKEKARKYSEVDLSRGTEFGIRLTQRVAFDDNGRFRYATYEEEQYDRDRNRDDREYRDRERGDRYDRNRDDREYRDR